MADQTAADLFGVLTTRPPLDPELAPVEETRGAVFPALSDETLPEIRRQIAQGSPRVGFGGSDDGRESAGRGAAGTGPDYSPLGRGIITGSAKPAAEYDATDFRKTNPRWQPGNFEKNVEAVERLRRPATAKGITVSQLALAWLLAQGEQIVPIPGTRSAARMEENARAADVTLTEADLSAIREILPTGGFGARYAEEHIPNWV